MATLQLENEHSIVSFALVSVGSNRSFGGLVPSEIVKKALYSVDSLHSRLISASKLYATPAFPPGIGRRYVNAVFSVETILSARNFLSFLHELEAGFSRERAQRWGDRTLDLDLISFGDLVVPDAETQSDWRTLPADRQIDHTPDELILPHPRVQDRAFVLVPLAEVAPLWRHPITGKSVTDMLAALPGPDVSAIKALPEAADALSRN